MFNREALDLSPGLISYLSLSKLEQLQSAIDPLVKAAATETTETSLSGDVSGKISGLLGVLSGQATTGGARRKVLVREGEVNVYKTLADTIAHYRRRDAIADLRACIAEQQTPDGARLFAVSSVFSAQAVDRKDPYVEAEQTKEDAVPVYHHGLQAEAGMCVLQTVVDGYDLLLACSLKFFGGMGSSRRFGKDGAADTFQITPHSGNWHFFDGKVPTRFDALFFLSHQDDRTLYGSPLVLYQSFRPSFAPDPAAD